MKKFLSLLLALCLLLSCCAALGEAAPKTELGSINMNGAFRLVCSVPENYSLQVVTKDDEGMIAAIPSEDPVKPQMVMVIEFDETYYDVYRMNDMSDEQLQAIADTFSSDGDEVAISYRETSHGTKLMVAQEAEGDTDFLSILAIYEGYMIEFDMTAGPEAQEGLTEAQIQMCVDFLSDLDFIPEE